MEKSAVRAIILLHSLNFLYKTFILQLYPLSIGRINYKFIHPIKKEIKMKKTILIVALVVLALGVVGVGAAFAQDAQPPVGRGGGMMGGGYGPMHDYVEEALADKLGITEKDIEDALASGKTMYQIALDNDIKEADVAALLTEVHTTAFDKAVADGVVTREQADFMLQRMTTNGFNSGNCTMQNGQGRQNGRGNGNGGGMMGGGRWQTVQP
jgi:hypothetical protein